MAITMWRCPHCGAPQAETARCWVCRRSSTTCSTCTHFRRALAGDLGYCGLDAKRLPLTGLELRGCWQARPAEADAPAPGASLRARHRPQDARIGEEIAPDAPALAFVPVELLRPIVTRQPPPKVEASAESPPPPVMADAEDGWGDRTSLFGDLEG